MKYELEFKRIGDKHVVGFVPENSDGFAIRGEPADTDILAVISLANVILRILEDLVSGGMPMAKPAVVSETQREGARP